MADEWREWIVTSPSEAGLEDYVQIDIARRGVMSAYVSMDVSQAIALISEYSGVIWRRCHFGFVMGGVGVPHG